MTAQPAARVLFHATLHPHRSLGTRGFRILMAAAALWMLGGGLVFLAMGAWPVFGFCGIEFLLLYAAFRINFRQGRMHERLLLTDSGLDVRRYGPGGDETGRWWFEPGWLRVGMDDPPLRESRLTLSSHGTSLVVGAFLTPAERLEVAQALRDAIGAYRQNPAPAS